MSVPTARMATALQDGSPRGLFVAIQHPSGTGYFATGIGSRTWNGHTWAGTGKFMNITPIKHTSDIAIQDITFSISGIDPTILNGVGDEVQGLNGSVWLYCLASDDSVVPDPYQLINSELDYQSIVIDPNGTATVSILAHSGFYTLARAIEEAWTPQNQKNLFPTDTGLDMVPGLINQNVQWLPVAP